MNGPRARTSGLRGLIARYLALKRHSAGATPRNAESWSCSKHFSTPMEAARPT